MSFQMSANLQAVFYDKAETDSGFAIAYALMQLTHAAHGIAEAIGDQAAAIDRITESLEKTGEMLAARL